MEQCRICLKHRKKLHSVYDTDAGITFLDMMTSLTKLMIRSETNIPDKLCLSCRSKLREAYAFKILIERSEMVLNKTAYLKRINFSNFHDIKTEIDYKPLVRLRETNAEKFFKNDTESIVYYKTIIKRVEGDKIEGIENQITVKEFLNSVKLQSDDDYDDKDFEIDAEYDQDSEGKSDEGPQWRIKKNSHRKHKEKRKNPRRAVKQLENITPIKPVYLKDVKIKHTQVKHKNLPKKKYSYPAKTSVCPYCGKLLRSKYVDVHMLLHTGERSYKCDQCSKSFHTEQILRQHKKWHAAPKKYKCDQCIASFVCKVLLQSHMIVHSDERNHICGICSKAFKRRDALRRHQVIHNFGKKAIQCELCPMTFHERYFLQHHMRVHTGERPYKCEICSQPYSYKHDFNRHCLKKHGVFLKRRSIKVMNEEVLQQERALMKDLTLRAHGVIKGDDIPSVFEGAKGALAFEQAMKAVEAKQIPLTYAEITYKL